MDAVSTNLRRAWEFYFAYAILLTAGRAYSIFTPDAPEHLYFQILCAFDPDLPIAYILAVLQIVITVFHWFPLALYIFERPLGPRWLWKVMLVLRVILDVAGNSYAKNVLVSRYQTDPWLSFLTFLFIALPYVPWYWACWRYAFLRKQCEPVQLGEAGPKSTILVNRDGFPPT